MFFVVWLNDSFNFPLGWIKYIVIVDSKIHSGRTLEASPVLYSIKPMNLHLTKWSPHKKGGMTCAGQSQHQHLNCKNLIHFLCTASLFHGKECGSGIICYLWIVAFCGSASVTVPCWSHVENTALNPWQQPNGLPRLTSDLMWLWDCSLS